MGLDQDIYALLMDVLASDFPRPCLTIAPGCTSRKEGK